MTDMLSFPLEKKQRGVATQRYVLKQGDTFLIADALGDIEAADDGLFHNDTRILSHLSLDSAARRLVCSVPR